MLSLESWRTRLKPATKLPVEIAADIDVALENRNLQSVMLVLGKDSVRHAGMHPRTQHEVTSEVLLITKLQRTNRGLDADVKDRLAAARKPLLDQLINWLPEGADVAVRWTGGQLLEMNSQSVSWVDVLTVGWQWRMN